jgi:hypothetical protein
MASGPARNRLYQLVRDFALQTPAWGTAVRYFTMPDEAYDLTLVSERVYGNRDEALVIQAAAGLDSPELPLTERPLVLPTVTQLAAMKARAGYGD